MGFVVAAELKIIDRRRHRRVEPLPRAEQAQASKVAAHKHTHGNMI